MRSLFFLALATSMSPICFASLIGTTVTGDLNFAGGTTNFYDPANGFVPATGYQNSPDAKDSPTVIIVGGNEFGFEDGANLDVTSFSATGFTFTDTPIATTNNASITLTLTNTAFASVTEVTNSFPGLTFGVAGDVITLNIPAFSVTLGEPLAASFSVTSPTSPVPEPSSVALLLVGASWLTYLRRRQ